jgi:hypothetical protein
VTRRKWAWSLAAVVILVVAGIVAAVLISSRHDDGDCRVARSMIDYNKSQSQLLADAFNPDQDRQPAVSAYRAWADRLRQDSTRIAAPELAQHADRLADEADQLVGLVEEARTDKSVPADPDAPPPWAQPYAELSHQFHDNLVALDQACPKQ